MLSTLHRLQLATRIHLALLRRRGEGVDLARMLRHADVADDTLDFCHSSDDERLATLAHELRVALAAEDAKTHLAAAAESARLALARIPLGAAPTMVFNSTARSR